VHILGRCIYNQIAINLESCQFSLGIPVAESTVKNFNTSTSMSENSSQAQVKAKIAQEIAEALVKPKSGRQQPNPLTTQLVKQLKEDKPKQSKFGRISTDMQSLRDASQALPSVYKFFGMIYRLSPFRTVVIMAVFIIQGLLPALRLRTGGDFIRHVISSWFLGLITATRRN
jgi:hypothetical protein